MGRWEDSRSTASKKPSQMQGPLTPELNACSGNGRVGRLQKHSLKDLPKPNATNVGSNATNVTSNTFTNENYRLASIQPEEHLRDCSRAESMLLIKQPRDVYLCIKDVKTHICDILKETLSISIGTKEFRLTFYAIKAREMYQHHLSDDTSIYKALLQCELDYTSTWIRFTARPPIVW